MPYFRHGRMRLALIVSLALALALVGGCAAGVETASAPRKSVPSRTLASEPPVASADATNPQSIDECEEVLVGLCPPLAAAVRDWFARNEQNWDDVANKLHAYERLVRRSESEGASVLSGHCGDLVPVAGLVRGWERFPAPDGQTTLENAARRMEFVRTTCQTDLELDEVKSAPVTVEAVISDFRLVEGALIVAVSFGGHEYIERYPA